VSLVRNYAFMLRVGWKHAPGLLLHTFALVLIHRIVIFFEHVYSLKFIIDAIQHGDPFWHVLAYIGAVAGGVTLCIAWTAWLEEGYKLRGLEVVHRELQKELFAQAARLDLACYDDPVYYNDFVRAVNEAPQKFDTMLERLKQLSALAVTVASSLAFVVVADLGGLVFVVVGLALSLWTARKQGQEQFALETENLGPRRQMAALTRVFYLADHAKELRLGPVAAHLHREYDATVARAEGVVRRHAGVLGRLRFFQEFVLANFLFDGLYLAYLVVKLVVWHQISLGDLVALNNTLGWTVRTLQEGLALVPDLQKDSLYVAALRRFLDRRPTLAPPADPEPLPGAPWTWRLKNVGFAYPGTPDRPILAGVDLTLAPGEKLAVVGSNGAGKTTLTKLLMRLYDPTSGVIELNGVDIRRFDPEAYRGLVATVFQDFQVFAASVAENVVLGRVEVGTEPKLTAALGQAGFGDRLARLPQGLNTPLTREFEETGVNLSGGENQKIALARVFSRNQPAALLDEPSSALDPVSEARLNQTLAEAARDRSVLFISHRLSSTRMADRIVLLDQGRILEEGTHDQLVARGGVYARMFQMQAERYRPPNRA